MNTEKTTNQVWESWRDDRMKTLTQQRDELLAALSEAYDLVSNSDVKHYISTKLGEQARLHSAINKARAAIARAEGRAQ